MTDTNHPGQVAEAASPETRVRRLLVGARRKLRLVRAVEAAAVAATAGALLAAAILLVAWLADPTGLASPAYLGAVWHVPLVLIPLAAAAGAAVALLRPIKLRQAGRCLDSRAHLHDMLATAAELIESPHAEESVVRVVCTQALRAAERADALKVPLWSHTRATAAALGLSVLLCAAATALAATTGGRQLSETVSTVRRMTPQQRERFAAALREAAQHAGLDEDAPTVADAADAARNADADQLRRALAELRRAGMDTSALSRRDTQPPEPPDEFTGAEPETPDVNEVAKEAALRVYSPPSAQDAEIDDEPESFRSAWSRARARADESLAAGRIPPRYRPLVRRYFQE